jgi:hypothetical protein
MNNRLLKLLRAAGLGTAGLIAASSVGVAVTPDEIAAYEAAVKSDSLAAFSKFLEEYPTGPLSERILQVVHDRLPPADPLANRSPTVQETQRRPGAPAFAGCRWKSCRPVQKSTIDRYDLAIIADFSSHSDDCWRVGEEVRYAAGLGYSVGLINVAEANARVHPDIVSCLFEGLAVGAPLDGWVETKLLLVATPDSRGQRPTAPAPYRARPSLVIVTDPNVKGDLVDIDSRLRFLFGDVVWTAYDDLTLTKLSKTVPSAPEPWPVVIDCDRGNRRTPGAVIGSISFGASDLPLKIEGFHTLPLGARQSAGGFAFDEITLGQFLAKLDYLAYYDQGALP